MSAGVSQDPASDEIPPSLVELRGLSKRFGSVVANDDISLVIRAGEVHALLGENGAGKTTLLNALAGMTRPDAGEILVRGEAVALDSPRTALRLGIGTVYQHFALVPTLSIVENVVLGTEGASVLGLRRAERRVRDLLAAFGLGVSPRTEVRHLAIGQRQRVEIVKALYRGSRVLLLDEPTSTLTPAEVEELFALLRRLTAEGVAVVLITHKLEEALAVSDRITVLRRGRKVGEVGPGEVAGAEPDRAAVRGRIVGLMFGGTPVGDPLHPEARPADMPRGAGGPVVLSLRDVSVLDDRGAPALRDVSLDLRAGEVFGVAGVDGNGQRELAEVIIGQRPTLRGRLVLDGVDVTKKGAARPAKGGIGYVTDDRLGEGFVPSGSVAENLALKAFRRPPFARGLLLDRRAMEAHARRLMAAFDVRAPGPAARVSTLSGGNIQKLLLARELTLDPAVLVCNKPTAGLDLKTARFVLDALRAHADAGNSVLLVSAELDELLEVADQIGVLAGGRLVATFARGEADAATIGRAMLGAAPDHAVAGVPA